jgi:ATP-dependent Clp protease protease subunit
MSFKIFMKEPAKKAPELYIYDEIGSPWAANPVTITTVRDRLNAVGDAPELIVRVNSVGGSVTDGMAIYNAIKEFPGRKTAIVEGLAASIASVVIMACDDVVMTTGSFLMIHNPFAVAQGESEDLRRTADLLDNMRDQMLAIYEEATGLPRAELEAMVDKETYLTAEEAVEKGFADRVSATGSRIAASAVRLLAKPPEALKKAALAKETTMDEKEYEKMKAELAASKEECEALKAKLSKFEKSDDDDDDGDGDEDEESSTGTGEEAKASVLMARVVLAACTAYGVQDLEKLAEAIKAGGRPQSRKEAVEKAVADGKLPPAMKAWAMSKHTPMAAVQELISGARSSVQPGVLPAAGPSDPALPPAIPAGPGAPQALSKTEREVMKMLGVDEAHMIQARAVPMPRAAFPVVEQAQG